MKTTPLSRNVVETEDRKRFGSSGGSPKSRRGRETGAVPSPADERPPLGKATRIEKVIETCALRMFLRQRELQRLTSQGPATGTIWATSPKKEQDLFGPLVLVLETPESEQEALRVALVTQNCDEYEDGDVRLPRRQSGLHFSCIIRVSLVFSIEPEALLTCVGILSSREMRSVRTRISESTRSNSSFDSE